MDVENQDIRMELAPSLPRGRVLRSRTGQTGMSYKFQRLREKIRAAITSGELSGKLPGERALARRFHVNAKTLSKALTDLAAEGMLDRSIGRGTYVKGSAPVSLVPGRWLVISDPADRESALVQALRIVNPELQVATSISDFRPSFINQFAAVIDTASNTPEAFLRDMVVRNMPVVAVNREPKTYSMHSVLLDMTLGTSRLGRDLMLAGHRHIAAVEPRGDTTISIALRQAVSRYAPDAVVDACSADEIRSLLDSGVTGIVCSSCAGAEQVKAQLHKASLPVPSQVSLAALGSVTDIAPCSGYFCSARQLAEAVVGLLKDAAGSRPATLWLAGTWHDLGTVGPTTPLAIQENAPMRLGGILAS